MSQGKVDWSSPVARVAKPFGNEGEAVVALFDNFPEDFDMKEPLFVVIDGLTVPLFFDRFERRGNRKAIVLISDFYTEKRVANFSVNGTGPEAASMNRKMKTMTCSIWMSW